LYLHFENGVLLYECPAVTEMKSDFENTMKSCREVTEDYKQKQPVKNRIKRGFLRVLAPLL
jgi:cardiolipin synthase